MAAQGRIVHSTAEDDDAASRVVWCVQRWQQFQARPVRQRQVHQHELNGRVFEQRTGFSQRAAGQQLQGQGFKRQGHEAAYRRVVLKQKYAGRGHGGFSRSLRGRP